MPSTDADRSRPSNQPGADRSTHSISDAASALGLSTDAIRSRLRRGTLTGEKVDGEWRVFLPDAQERPVDQPVIDRARPVNRPDDVDLATLLERADIEIAWLRGQLEERGGEVADRSRELAAERERSDILHREALSRIAALTSGTDVPKVEVDFSPESGNKSPKSSQDAQDGSGATMAPSPHADSNAGAPNASRSIFGDLWRWIMGR